MSPPDREVCHRKTALVAETYESELSLFVSYRRSTFGSKHEIGSEPGPTGRLAPRHQLAPPPIRRPPVEEVGTSVKSLSSAIERGEDNACHHATNNPPLNSWTKTLQANSSAFPLERSRSGRSTEKSRSSGSRIDASVTTWRSSPNGHDSVLSRLGVCCREPKRATAARKGRPLHAYHP